MDSETSSLIVDYARRVESAEVYAVAIETPLDPAPRLSERLSNVVLLKREDLQPTFSFKCRGAENRIAQLLKSSAPDEVICSSAGNHAQGVALAARRRGLRAIIVMPVRTAQIKIDAVRSLGAEVLLHGENYDSAYSRAIELAEEKSLPFIHPFADAEVIAGQGTIAIELVRAWPRVPDAVFVPIGGGGLISGIGAYLKANHPNIKIIGIEPQDAASMHAALSAGRPVTLDRVGTFADGVAVRRVADETFRICQQVVDEIILVDTDEICAAIKDIFEDCRVVTEPAGALAVAGLKRYVERGGIEGQHLIAITSGANMDFNRLRHVGERAEIGEHRESLLAISIPERRGAFLEFCKHLGDRNITEFNYRHSSKASARIFVGVSIAGAREAEAIVTEFNDAGYGVIDLSHNELAKLHIRHMVGGYREDLVDEQLYRFEFPEHAGALRGFLEAVGVQWNISLFHYRNHGSDHGRVLAGVQVPVDERSEFTAHLATLGYPFWSESDNPAYRLFVNGGQREH